MKNQYMFFEEQFFDGFDKTQENVWGMMRLTRNYCLRDGQWLGSGEMISRKSWWMYKGYRRDDIWTKN